MVLRSRVSRGTARESGCTGDPRFEADLVGREEDKRVMTVIQENLADAGIDVTLEIETGSTYWDKMCHYRPMLNISGGASEFDPRTEWYRQPGTSDEKSGRGTHQKNL